jgi:hypothetical protein
VPRTDVAENELLVVVPRRCLSASEDHTPIDASAFFDGKPVAVTVTTDASGIHLSVNVTRLLDSEFALGPPGSPIFSDA